MLDKEMQKALEADGDKLLQLTGEDRGPYDVYDLPDEDRVSLSEAKHVIA